MKAMTIQNPASLEALLRRKDIWRGHSQTFVPQESICTGFESLDHILLHKGWPRGGLIELLQDSCAGTWFLLNPAIRAMLEQGLVAIVNPPAEPYVVALQRDNIDANKVFVVRTENKSDFISCFTELSKSKVFSMLIAWPSKQALNYTELRKCHLASLNSSILSFFFRHRFSAGQHSPAMLRMLVTAQARNIELECIKQKGVHRITKTQIHLPDTWFAMHQYKQLELQSGDSLHSSSHTTPWMNKHDNVLSIKHGKG